MLNVSVPVPVFLTTFEKLTELPGLALATVAPVMLTPAVWPTVNGTVFDVPLTVAPEPSLYEIAAVLLAAPGVAAAATVNLKLMVPDCPGATEASVAVTVPAVVTP